MLINYVRHFNYDLIRDTKDNKINDIKCGLNDSMFEEFFVHITETKIFIYETMNKFLSRNIDNNDKCIRLSKEDVLKYIVI